MWGLYDNKPTWLGQQHLVILCKYVDHIMEDQEHREVMQWANTIL